MIRASILLATLLGACTSAAADHERLGDRAYREERFTVAVAEYRAAAKSRAAPRLYAKLGNAALHDRDLPVAVSAFSALQENDPARAAEAAVGLERAAYLAERGGESQRTYLAAAVRALRSVAPGRPLGRFAMAPTAGLDATEMLGTLPAALASAADGRTVDSLLIAYGEAQRVTTACEAATRTYAVVLRRTHDGGLRSTASLGLGICALRLGLDALAGARSELAERWFQSALEAAPATPAGWRAAIGLGDARLGQGDPLGAAKSYQTVLSGTAVPDSLLKLAGDKLNALGGSPPPGPEGTLR